MLKVLDNIASSWFAPRAVRHKPRGHHSEARPHHHGPTNSEIPEHRQTVLIINAHHHEDHVDPVCRCGFHGLEMRCKGKIITDAMNYEVVKKIMTPGSADKGSYMATMSGGSHDPQFLVSHWWGGVFPPRCHVYFGACHTTLGQELASVRKLCSSGRVHMEVQPLVRASVENLEDLSQDMYVAPLNGANTICTNECRPGQTLDMQREQLSRSSLHNNIIYRFSER